MNLTQAFKDSLHQHGFELVGVTLPVPPPHLNTYTRWVQAGLHAEMAYLASERALERRADPRLILPEARSLVVAGIRYANPHTASPTPSGELTGRTAAYAWGNDYHEILPPLLQASLAQWTQRTGLTANTRIYTDTGPLLERDFAVQAGLGWFGKHTCLIAPQAGSYFLLAEILLDVELEPDPPFDFDRCGSCHRCIEACPTGCIRPDRTLDASKCISYLTIENKGAIPPALRPQLGDWVFGCDVCQSVCPWNLRFAAAPTHPAFTPREGLPHPPLLAGLKLTPQTFNQQFRGSPVQRARRRGYLRNLCVALGNTGAPQAAAGLLHTLQNESEPLVRAHAAWALGRLHSKAARSGLEKARTLESEASVLEEINAALAE